MKIRATYLLLISLTFAVTGYGQFHGLNIDSLKGSLRKSSADSISIHRVITKAVELPHDEYDAKIIMLKWSAAQSKHHHYPLLEMNSYTELGWVYSESHDQVNTVKYFNAGRALAEKLGLREDELSCLATIASVYFYADQKHKAREIYEQVLSLCKKYKLDNGIDNAYSNLGVTYYDLSKNDTALRAKAIYYIKTGQKLSLAQNDTAAVVSNYQVLSRVYLDKNQSDSALYYIGLALDWAITHNMKLPFSSIYFSRGFIFEREKKFAPAISDYTQGLRWAKKFNQAFWVAEQYECLATCYANTGEYKKAYDYWNKYTGINDSIKNSENFAKAADIQNKYEREKKERLILKLAKNVQIKQLNIEKESQLRKKLYFISTGITLLGLSLIILVVFQIRNLREKRASYQALQQKNIDIQNKSGRLAYQSRLIAKYQSQMNPHFIFNAVNNIQGLVLAGNSEKSVQQLENFKFLMQQTLANSENDYISLLQETNYLKQYVEFEQARFDHPFTFTVQLPDDADRILVPPMIVQPFIENAIKHAALHTVQSSFIKVAISTTTFLHIRISDNGKGFDMNKSNVFKKGHALDIIQSRIQLFFEAEKIPLHKNFFTVQSTQGLGTQIEIILPLRHA